MVTMVVTLILLSLAFNYQDRIMPLTLPAIFDNFNERKDRSTTLRFETRELTDSELIELRGYKGFEGHLLFSMNQIKDDDIPTTDAEVETKTKSQRLRSVLYLVCKQENGKPTDEDVMAHYNREMERIIQHYKAKLD